MFVFNGAKNERTRNKNENSRNIRSRLYLLFFFFFLLLNPDETESDESPAIISHLLLVVHSHLKRPGANQVEVANYSPVSNMTLILLSWLQDYLTDRSQSVSWNGTMSAPRPVHSGVPQESVPGPILFILYVADIGKIIKSFGLAAHSYADNVRIYSSCLSTDMARLHVCVSDCITKIKQWTEVNRLALNPGKTEFL